MFQVILITLLVLAAGFFLFVGYNSKNEEGYMPKWMLNTIGSVLGFIATFLFIALSVVYVDKNEIAILEGVYLNNDMRSGQIVATAGQNGPQAKTMPPGFHFESFIRFFYDVDYADTITIPDNQYGIVTAKDGLPLREGQVIADKWSNHEEMINADTFLAKGGQKGMQLTVLKPGQYRINPYLFSIKLGNALQVKTGEVAVIRSNVTDKGKVCTTAINETGLTTALVPKGCKGVWNEPLYQGMYFLNENAYKHTIISTRVQVWAYKGGYTTKKISLTVNNDGTITQTSTPIEVLKPEGAADKAINVRVEGWTVPVEARVTVQVSPEDAPKVVAGVGSLQNVEDKITTPNIRDSLRTIGGRAPSGCNKAGKRCKDAGAKVLDFVSNREDIARRVLEAIKPSTEQAGVTILDVNLGEPAIPPELLVANQRKQIAEQLRKTYIAERETQKERIKSEREKATATQQPSLVKAEIARKASLERMQTRENDGIGERKYLEQLARGESARAAVLGKERVFDLEVLKIVALNPEMVKVPAINVVSGSGGGLEGAAAIFGGASNLSKFMSQSATNVPVAK